MKRYLVLLGVVAAALAATVVAVVVFGRGDGRAVLYAGQSSPLGMKTTVVTDAEAASDGREVRSEWSAHLPRVGPTGQTGTMSAHEFHSRLARAAGQYGFSVKRVEFTHDALRTPLVVVQTKRYTDFVHAIPDISHPVRRKSHLRDQLFKECGRWLLHLPSL